MQQHFLKTAFLCAFLFSILEGVAALIPLPSFGKMKSNYPGYSHAGGRYHNNQLINMIGCKRDFLLHDTSALRLSYVFNKVGGKHSLGDNLIHLSRNGIDSVKGSDGHQYIHNPITYGPFLADKYGYPSVSKLHQLDPINTMKHFWGKQGILQVITYRKIKNLPVGHIALWDCDHFHETKDWISGHSLITVEFWETPDSNCSHMMSADKKSKELNLQHDKSLPYNQQLNAVHSTHLLPVQASHPLPQSTHQLELSKNPLSTKNYLNAQKGKFSNLKNSKTDIRILLQDKAFRKQFIKKHYVSNGHLRHAKHRGLAFSGIHHG